MANIVVLGGGVIGLSMALLLTKEGLDVTVLERDSGPVPQSPQEAWQAWDRRGVVQFRQPHYLAPGGRGVLDDVLPEVTSALAGAHGAVYDALSGMPPSVTDRAPREGDERFVTVTGRRPVLEYAVASVAGQVVDIRRGVQVAGLVAGPSAAKGIPHVTGVRLAGGEQVPADLVIDATGRRSALPGWLAEIGARDPAEEAADSGFTYYTRYFRSADGVIPPFRTGLLNPDIFRAFMETMMVLTLPQEVLARPGLTDRIMGVAGGSEAVMPPGPSRREVLKIVA